MMFFCSRNISSYYYYYYY